MVAEAINAKLEKDDVVKRMWDLEGGPKVKISGVWRLWFEHPPNEVLVQGGTVPKPADTNPDHVFELHPLTVVDGRDADLSFVPIAGYTVYTAEKAFKVYEKLEFRAKRNSVFTTLSSTKAGFNYTEFAAVLAGKPMHFNDATFALADVLDDNGNSVVAKPRRLVFADDEGGGCVRSEEPQEGTAITVIGIPRVNLDKLMDEAEQSPGETVIVKGAYEIIVIGVR